MFEVIYLTISVHLCENRCAGPQDVRGMRVISTLKQRCNTTNSTNVIVVAISIILLLIVTAVISVTTMAICRYRLSTASQSDINPIIDEFNVTEEATYEFN
jgi:hypothetical protein